MALPSSRAQLRAEHLPDVISSRLATRKQRSYLRDLVFGGIDGTITTFAVVAACFGAGIASEVALILGLANLLADGFSMAASNYLGSKAERQEVERARAIEELHVTLVPEGEREEIRQIFRAKGLEGDLLEQVTDVITSDRERWIKTMLVEEHGLSLAYFSPTMAGLATFGAFSGAGIVPLIPLFFVEEAVTHTTLLISSALASLVFLSIGWFKGYVLGRPKSGSAVETLLLGGTATGLGYLVGWALGSS